MPLREKITRSNRIVPRGNPSVGLDECSIGTVMDGAGVRSCSLFITLPTWLRAQTCEVWRLGAYIYLEGNLQSCTCTYKGWWEVDWLARSGRQNHPWYWPLASAVVHMHLLAVVLAWRWSHCLSFLRKRSYIIWNTLLEVGRNVPKEVTHSLIWIEVSGMSPRICLLGTKKNEDQFCLPKSFSLRMEKDSRASNVEI